MLAARVEFAGRAKTCAKGSLGVKGRLDIAGSGGWMGPSFGRGIAGDISLWYRVRRAEDVVACRWLSVAAKRRSPGLRGAGTGRPVTVERSGRPQVSGDADQEMLGCAVTETRSRAIGSGADGWTDEKGEAVWRVSLAHVCLAEWQMTDFFAAGVSAGPQQARPDQAGVTSVEALPSVPRGRRRRGRGR